MPSFSKKRVHPPTTNPSNEGDWTQAVRCLRSQSHRAGGRLLFRPLEKRDGCTVETLPLTLRNSFDDGSWSIVLVERGVRQWVRRTTDMLLLDSPTQRCGSRCGVVIQPLPGFRGWTAFKRSRYVSLGREQRIVSGLGMPALLADY